MRSRNRRQQLAGADAALGGASAAAARESPVGGSGASTLTRARPVTEEPSAPGGAAALEAAVPWAAIATASATTAPPEANIVRARLISLTSTTVGLAKSGYAAPGPNLTAPMPLSVQIGLLLSIATALCSIVGFLYKHRGAVERPDVDWRRPVWSALMLFGSRWYTLGVLIALAGWGTHVGALALAPISLVQATIAGGLVMLTVVADRFFAHEVSRREWIGVALAAAGLAFLAATLDGGADEAHSDYESADPGGVRGRR